MESHYSSSQHEERVLYVQKTMVLCDEGDVDVTAPDDARRLEEYRTVASPGTLGEGGVVSGLHARHIDGRGISSTYSLPFAQAAKLVLAKRVGTPSPNTLTQQYGGDVEENKAQADPRPMSGTTSPNERPAYRVLKPKRRSQDRACCRQEEYHVQPASGQVPDRSLDKRAAIPPASEPKDVPPTNSSAVYRRSAQRRGCAVSISSHDGGVSSTLQDQTI